MAESKLAMGELVRAAAAATDDSGAAVALETLAKVCFGAAVPKRVAGECGAVAAVTSAMRAHPASARVQLAGAKAVRVLCVNAPLNRASASAAGPRGGAVGALCEALRGHAADGTVAAETVWALAAVCMNNDANANAARDAGALALVDAAAKAHGGGGSSIAQHAVFLVTLLRADEARSESAPLGSSRAATRPPGAEAEPSAPPSEPAASPSPPAAAAALPSTNLPSPPPGPEAATPPAPPLAARGQRLDTEFH